MFGFAGRGVAAAREHDVAYNLLMAASTLIVLPVVVVFVLAQRFFIEGITVGGVKG